MSLRTHSAALSFDLVLPARASAVARAIAVEAGDAPEGAVVSCHARGTIVEAHVTAPDGPAIRAAVTGVLRLLDAAARTAALAR